MTYFGKAVKNTYHIVKYRSCFSKITSWYFCQSKCCRKLPKNIFDEYDENKIKAEKALKELLSAHKPIKTSANDSSLVNNDLVNKRN